MPKDFALKQITDLSEQVRNLREKSAAKSGWKQDVSNLLESQGWRFSNETRMRVSPKPPTTKNDLAAQVVPDGAKDLSD